MWREFPEPRRDGCGDGTLLLGQLVTRVPRIPALPDWHGTMRRVAPAWDVRELVQIGLEEPVQFAAGRPAVLRRIAALLQELAWRAPRGPLDDDLHVDAGG